MRKRLDGTSSSPGDPRQEARVRASPHERQDGQRVGVHHGEALHARRRDVRRQGRDPLDLDGAVAAQTHVTGPIAPGAGPVFVGNDANGRQFKGIVDTVWLNTLAAPADVVRGFLCVRKPPIVSLTPGQTPPQVSGATVAFDLSVTNANGSFCPADTFAFFSNVFYPLTSNGSFGELSIAPGETAHATVQVASVNDAPIGAFPFQYFVYDEAGSQFFASALATYVVGSQHVSMGIPLPPDANGHYDGSNPAGVVGNWWSTGDDYGADATAGAGNCRMAGFPATACSVLSAPTPGLPFQPIRPAEGCAPRASPRRSSTMPAARPPTPPSGETSSGST